MSYSDRGQRGAAPATGTMSLDDVKKIIAVDNAKLLVEQAEAIGKQAAEARLTTNQIRNVYGPVRQIELTWPVLDERSSEQDRQLASKAYREVILLKPKLGYLAARDPKLATLERLFSAAIDEIGNSTEDRERRIRFKRFVEFFEAILAYHKKYGGK